MQRQKELEQEMSKNVQHLDSLQEMEQKLEEMQVKYFKNLFDFSKNSLKPEQIEQIRAHRIAITEQLQRLQAP